MYSEMLYLSGISTRLSSGSIQYSGQAKSSMMVFDGVIITVEPPSSTFMSVVSCYSLNFGFEVQIST